MKIDEPITWSFPDTIRVLDLRERVRAAMEIGPAPWECPPRIKERFMSEPLAVRKARAIALKLSHMPVDLWKGQLFAGSMALESPRVHTEWTFPQYATESEVEAAAQKGLSIHSVFGHVVPDYPALLLKGLRGIRSEVEAQRAKAATPRETAFLDSEVIALDAVMDYALRLAGHCESLAETEGDTGRAAELRQMTANLRQSPAGPARTFWQALQAVWLLHMIFHTTMNGNAMGRLDQYSWPLLRDDLEGGRLDWGSASELLDCFCLKFNERAQTTEEQRPESRKSLQGHPKRTRHTTSTQLTTELEGLEGADHWLRLASDRDRFDATNHWLQNIIVGGLRPDGRDGTNPLAFLLLDSYRRNQMTNPLLSVRVHRDSPDDLVAKVCEVLREGGGMPALFNDEAIVPALCDLGIAEEDSRDYTNDGCWEVILPGRTDFRFQRLSLALCLEWVFNRGITRFNGEQEGLDTSDPRAFSSYEEVWQAFLKQLDAMVGGLVAHVVDTIDDRSTIAPVPLLSALMQGTIASRRDMTGGGAKYRTFGLLAESAAHAIDSLTAIKTLVFDRKVVSMADLCDAVDADFQGWESLRASLQVAPKYGNDEEEADAVGRDVIQAFTEIAARHAESFQSLIRFPCGVGTFSWYVGIGEGLGASADGRLAGQPVSSNFSPALGRDMAGIPAAILSHSKMHHRDLPAGAPLDLRLARRLVQGPEGATRMIGLVRGFVDGGGSIMTLTVVDTEELREAQREPEKHRSLRVRMGGWCAYFTMLSREQQDHHIRRQEARS